MNRFWKNSVRKYGRCSFVCHNEKLDESLNARMASIEYRKKRDENPIQNSYGKNK